MRKKVYLIMIVIIRNLTNVTNKCSLKWHIAVRVTKLMLHICTMLLLWESGTAYSKCPLQKCTPLSGL